jgi:hypothetical protein
MKRVRFRKTVVKKPAVKPEEPEAEQPDQPSEVSPDTQSRLLFREEQRREGDEAMADYLAQQEATREKTARLRAARETREANLKHAGKAKAER